MDMTWLHQVIDLCPDEIDLENDIVKAIYKDYMDKFLYANNTFWISLKNNTSEDSMKEIILSLYKSIRDEVTITIENNTCDYSPDEYYIIPSDPLYFIREEYDNKITQISREFWIKCDEELNEDYKNEFLTKFMES